MKGEEKSNEDSVKLIEVVFFVNVVIFFIVKLKENNCLIVGFLEVNIWEFIVRIFLKKKENKLMFIVVKDKELLMIVFVVFIILDIVGLKVVLLVYFYISGVY